MERAEERGARGMAAAAAGSGIRRLAVDRMGRHLSSVETDCRHDGAPCCPNKKEPHACMLSPTFGAGENGSSDPIRSLQCKGLVFSFRFFFISLSSMHRISSQLSCRSRGLLSPAIWSWSHSTSHRLLLKRPTSNVTVSKHLFYEKKKLIAL